MRSAFRFALLALVLVIVAMVSALTAMQLAIHGQEVAVPPLVGLTPAEAERQVTGLGLQISIERQYYSPQIPEGRIMSQLPLPATKVRHGWQVRVAQSLGPTRVAIPDVTGQSEHAAELNIRRRGLDVASMAEVPTAGIPADQVLAQSPPANAAQVLAPKISLLVTTPAQPQAFVMPSFVGQPLGSVSRTLQDAGFRLGNVSVAAPAVAASADAANPSGVPGVPSAPVAPPAPVAEPSPASVIVSQVPPAGQKVVVGAVVSFEVRQPSFLDHPERSFSAACRNGAPSEAVSRKESRQFFTKMAAKKPSQG
jgi:eukaryotic-like serine/threonine-protein kinase